MYFFTQEVDIVLAGLESAKPISLPKSPVFRTNVVLVSLERRRRNGLQRPDLQSTPERVVLQLLHVVKKIKVTL